MKNENCVIHKSGAFAMQVPVHTLHNFNHFESLITKVLSILHESILVLLILLFWIHVTTWDFYSLSY